MVTPSIVADVPPGEVSLGNLRERELRTAGTILGVSDYLLLDFADSGMSGEPAPGTLAAALPGDVMRAVGQVLESVQPALVVTLDPDHGDGHRDHVAIGAATTAACALRAGIDLYYWALPRPLLQRWFDELAQVRPGSEHLDLDRAGLGRADSDVTHVIDVSSHRDARERAIAAHASQVWPYHGMPASLRDDFLNTDRLVQVATGPCADNRWWDHTQAAWVHPKPQGRTNRPSDPFWAQMGPLVLPSGR